MAVLLDHVLRTFAAVPVGQRVLVCGAPVGEEVASLTRLGLETHACTSVPEEVAALREALADVLDDETARRRMIAISRLDALGYPDDYFDWIIMREAGRQHQAGVLAELRRVLVPGGWLYVVAPVEAEDDVPGQLTRRMVQNGFAVASRPQAVEGTGASHVQGIYRRVEKDTPL